MKAESQDFKHEFCVMPHHKEIFSFFVPLNFMKECKTHLPMALSQTGLFCNDDLHMNRSCTFQSAEQTLCIRTF